MVWILEVTCLFALFVTGARGLGEVVDRVSLVNNGYEGLVIAIDKDVEESETLLNKIKSLMSQASSSLYTATNSRAYFREITILVPSTWSDSLIDGDAEQEVYHNANIRIDKPTAEESTPQIPYTKMFQACGKPGKYIRLTSDYVINSMTYMNKIGIPPYVMVHEWAHLRWGVLDEYGLTADKKFYLRTDTNEYDATRCTLGITGNFITVDEDGKFVKTDCDKDVNTGMFVNCVFRPATSAGPASLMYYTIGPLIRQFCDNDTDSSGTLHNPEAPTLQNEVCAGKSAWEIMRETVDFKDGRNPKRTIDRADLAPSFKIVRDLAARPIMLILDVSGSMKKHGRLTAMRQAVSGFIETATAGNIIGLLTFSSTADLLVSPLEIKTDQDRKKLIDALPTTVGDTTSIGAGLQKALETLRGESLKLAGALFILLTDGKENRSPKVADIRPNITTEKVVVTTLAFSKLADPSLVELSAQTDGSFYYDNNDATSSGLTEAFQELAKKVDPDPERLIYLFTESFELDPEMERTVEFYIDESIGVNSKIRIGCSKETPVESSAVVISGPDSSTASCQATSQMKMIVCTISGTAKVGKWIVEITGYNTTQKFTVTISSERINKSDRPIVVRSEISATTSSLPPETAIYAELTKADYPVLGMDVKAVVYRPFGETTYVQLLDDGSGSDLLANDGIYSRAFGQASGTGRYALKIVVNPPANGKAVLKKTKVTNVGAPITGILQENGQMLIAKDTYTLINGLISRTATPGAFEIRIPGQDAPRKLSDIVGYSIDTAPSRIKDLLVIQTSETSGTVTLAWTAPGEDADTGTAQKYEIREAPTSVELLTNPSSANVVTQSQVLTGNLTSPKTAGELEIFVIKVAHAPGTNTTHAFIVRTADASGIRAEYSNVVAAGLGYVPDLKIKLLSPYEIARLMLERTATTSGPNTQPPPPASSSEPVKPISDWVLILSIALSVTAVIVIIIIGTVVIVKSRDNSHPKVNPFTAVA